METRGWAGRGAGISKESACTSKLAAPTSENGGVQTSEGKRVVRISHVCARETLDGLRTYVYTHEENKSDIWRNLSR